MQIQGQPAAPKASPDHGTNATPREGKGTLCKCVPLSGVPPSGVPAEPCKMFWHLRECRVCLDLQRLRDKFVPREPGSGRKRRRRHTLG